MTEVTESVNVVETVEEQQQDNNKQTSDESTKTFTQEQVNELMQKRLAKEQARAEKKQAEAIAKAIEDFKDEQAESERLKGLSEKDRLNEELNKANAQIEQLLAKQERIEMLKETRSQLASKSINVNDEMLEMITTDNAETTQQNISVFENWLNEQRKNWEVERSKGTTPKSMTTIDEKVVTKEQFDNMTSQEKVALFNDNPNLFTKLTGGR